MTKSERSGEQCPCCQQETMRKNRAHNSMSRFHDVYICSECGVREAFQGRFWQLTEKQLAAIQAKQDRWTR